MNLIDVDLKVNIRNEILLAGEWRLQQLSIYYNAVATIVPRLGEDDTWHKDSVGDEGLENAGNDEPAPLVLADNQSSDKSQDNHQHIQKQDPAPYKGIIFTKTNQLHQKKVKKVTKGHGDWQIALT